MPLTARSLHRERSARVGGLAPVRGVTLGAVPARLSLRSLRLRPGEERRERMDVALEPFVLGGVSYAVEPTPVACDVVVNEATGATVLELSAEAGLTGPCMRCLGPALVEVQIRAREVNSQSRGADPELRSEYVSDDDHDVEAWLRDLVALALPDQNLCRPVCAGLCGVCGKNLNDEPHEHEETALDPRWAALEDLRDQL